MALRHDWHMQAERLSAREVVLLNEVLRIEQDLQLFRNLATDWERESYELLLDQFQLVINRLSPEDDFIWQHVLRVACWLREETLSRTRSGDFDLAALVAQAEQTKGGPLTDLEYRHLCELAAEIEEVDRLLN